MVVLHVLILWGLVVLALSVAFLTERRRNKDSEKPEYGIAVSFVASSYGLLLGLLVSFGVSHYTNVRTQAQDEADSLLALWNTVDVYPSRIRDPTQHDLLCYMRAIRDDDWPSMERGNQLESPRALLFGDRLRATIAGLPQDAKAEGSAYGRAAGQLTDADKSRQQLLFATQSSVPTVLWVIIYVGAFLLFLLIAMHYAGRSAGRAVSLGCVVTLLTVVVSVLSILDQPYGPGARVQPKGLRHAIELVRVANAAAPRTTTRVFAPCTAARPA